MNFWQRLTKPFLVLSPMEDVTDVVFREVVATFLPAPDVFFTEFVSADGLCSQGYDKTVKKLEFTARQRPIVAQIWGTNPEHLFKATQIVGRLGFDGVDINMGCPIPKIVKNGACSALIMNHPLAKKIIEAVKRGAGNIPVSVKTRIGFKNIDTQNWISFLLKQNIAALTIHGRTAKQMSTGLANWEEIGKAVKLKNEISPKTILIGNGDIKSRNEATNMHKIYGVDGVMIARGIFGNPWVFSKEEINHNKAEYFTLLINHIDLFTKTWGDTKNFDIMKKFFKMYIKGFDGANELRIKLMECETPDEVKAILS